MSYQTSVSTAETSDLFPQETIIYGGFGERFGAAFIDGIILLIANLVIRFTVGETASTVFGLVMGWLYSAFMESGSMQATLGKKALGLKVVDLDGQRISFLQATGRHFGKFLSSAILLIGYLMMLWDDKKQTLHDKMAGTLVIKD